MRCLWLYRVERRYDRAVGVEEAIAGNVLARARGRWVRVVDQVVGRLPSKENVAYCVPRAVSFQSQPVRICEWGPAVPHPTITSG